MKKITVNLYAVLAVVALGIILFLCSFTVTHPGEYKVITQFGKIVRVEENKDLTNGISFKIPFIQKVKRISAKTQLFDLPPSDVMTSDKKTMIADCFVLWDITDPSKYIKNLSASEQSATSRINSNVYNALKNVISSLTQEEIISGRDGGLSVMITDAVGDTLTAYGINIQKVETKMLDLPNENKNAVYQRMISERDNIAAGFTAQGKQQAQEIKNATNEDATVIIAQAKKEADMLVAGGEAEYMRILSNAYNNTEKADFYSFVRQLDAIKVTLKNGENTIVLDKTSPIAELFYK